MEVRDSEREEVGSGEAPACKNQYNILKHSFVALLAKRQSKVVTDRNVYRGVQVGQVG